MAGVKGPEIKSVEDKMLPTAMGTLPVRLYRSNDAGRQPLIIYFHGGGFVIGDLDTHDRNARGLAAETGATIMSVDYRLAPEHPFPAAVEDALSAVIAAAARADDLGVDANRLFVAGDSAGAVLALVAALTFKNGAGPRISGVIAVYPSTDFANIGKTKSYRLFGGGDYGLLTNDIEWFRELYAPNVRDRMDWRCSPAFAPDLRGLPPTIVIAAYYDVLRDESAALASQLRAAGVSVVFHLVPGVNHGFMGAPNPPAAVGRTLAAIGEWFRTLG